MRIGLYDYDFTRRPKKSGLSVELMQLAAYYESKGHFISFMYQDEDKSKYDKIVVYANIYTLNGPFKKYISNFENVEFIGAAFTNWQSLPITNEEIISQPIKTDYYINLLKRFVRDKLITKQRAQNLLNTQWIKLYQNNKPIKIDSILTGDKYYITDNDFLQKEDFDNIFQYLNIYYRYYTFYNSLIITNKQELENFKKLKDARFVGLTGVILFESYEQLEKFIMENLLLLQELAPKLRLALFYDVRNIYDEQFYFNELINSIKKIKILADNNLKFKSAEIKDYSDRLFIKELVDAFIDFSLLTQECYYEAFLFKYKHSTRILHDFYLLLNRRPELYYWFKLRIKRSELNE